VRKKKIKTIKTSRIKQSQTINIRPEKVMIITISSQNQTLVKKNTIDQKM
jgi:hypothetical protein